MGDALGAIEALMSDESSARQIVICGGLGQLQLLERESPPILYSPPTVESHTNCPFTMPDAKRSVGELATLLRQRVPDHASISREVAGRRRSPRHLPSAEGAAKRARTS